MPNLINSEKAYQKWRNYYRNYRKKNLEKIRAYDRVYKRKMRARLKNLSTDKKKGLK